jgi:hypothetical protein
MFVVANTGVPAPGVTKPTLIGDPVAVALALVLVAALDVVGVALLVLVGAAVVAFAALWLLLLPQPAAVNAAAAQTAPNRQFRLMSFSSVRAGILEIRPASRCEFSTVRYELQYRTFV